MANTLFDALFAPLSGRQSDLMILSDGGRISGDAFLRLVARQAHALRAAGLGTGDRIAAQVGKSPEALAAYGAADRTLGEMAHVATIPARSWRGRDLAGGPRARRAGHR